MTEDEVSGLVKAGKKLQLATINADGSPHLVTMFYGLVDDKIAFWSYGSSQKSRNMERDPRVTCLIELGEEYFELRGAMIYGKIETVTDPEQIRAIGTEVVKRMMNIDDPEQIAPFVDATAAKRFAYVVEPTRVASWDHRKLS